MSGPDFFHTRMGQRFFEVTMPKIADQLERVNTTLGSIAAALLALTTRPAPAHGSGCPTGATADWEATLAQIAREHLPSLEPQGSDASDFHEIAVSALGVALHAAYRIGVAATLRHLREAAPAGGQPGAHQPG